MCWSGRGNGFTLIELLVVIAIIVVLAAILWPVTWRRTPRSRSAACLGNIRSLALGVVVYAQDHGSHMPVVHRWADDIAPYVIRRKYFMCPRDEARESRAWRGSYAMSHSLSGDVTEDIPDRADRSMLWDADMDGHFARRHGKRGSVAFVDGHVKLHPGGLAGMERGWVDAPE